MGRQLPRRRNRPAQRVGVVQQEHDDVSVLDAGMSQRFLARNVAVVDRCARLSCLTHPLRVHVEHDEGNPRLAGGVRE